jgi:hypothetical protein
MLKELMKLMTSPDKTTGQDIMNEIQNEFGKTEINFKNIVPVTTDGAPITVRKHVGLYSFLQKVVQYPIAEFHCILNQQALCAEANFKSLEIFCLLLQKSLTLYQPVLLITDNFAKC